MHFIWISRFIREDSLEPSSEKMRHFPIGKSHAVIHRNVMFCFMFWRNWPVKIFVINYTMISVPWYIYQLVYHHIILYSILWTIYEGYSNMQPTCVFPCTLMVSDQASRTFQMNFTTIGPITFWNRNDKTELLETIFYEKRMVTFLENVQMTCIMSSTRCVITSVENNEKQFWVQVTPGQGKERMKNVRKGIKHKGPKTEKGKRQKPMDSEAVEGRPRSVRVYAQEHCAEVPPKFGVPAKPTPSFLSPTHNQLLHFCVKRNLELCLEATVVQDDRIDRGYFVL